MLTQNARCNRLEDPEAALPGPDHEEPAMKDRSSGTFLARLIDDPDWATQVTDPDARIADEEWRECEAYAARRRDDT